MHRVWNDAYVDWLIIVVFVTVLAGLYIGIGIITYENIKAQLTMVSTTKAQNVYTLFDTAALSRTLKEFESRATERSSIIKGYSKTSDPSL